MKPVPNEVLRARVRSLVRRRSSALLTEQLVLGNLHLNRLTRRVIVGQDDLELTPMELRLLEHLLMRAGQIVTRGELHDKVWDMHFDPSSNLVDAHVARLRRKLCGAGAAVELTTRRGVGFVLQCASAPSHRFGQDAYGVSSPQS